MPIKLIPPSDRSPNYRARGTYLPRTEHAVYVDRSLGTANRKEAQEELSRLLKDVKSGRISDKTGAVATGQRTFAEAVRDYVVLGGEDRFVWPIAKHFGDAKPISEITQKDVDAAAIAICPSGKPATRNRQVYTPISAIMKREGIALTFRRPKFGYGASRVHWLQPEQVFALLDGASSVSVEFGALLTFLFYCGARLSEALSLQWADVQVDASFAYLRDTKNGSPQAAHLPPVVIDAFTKLRRQSVYPPRAGRPQRIVTHARVFNGLTKCSRLYKMLDKAEEHSGVKIPEGVAFHIARHTWASWMRRYAGLDTSGLLATSRWKSRQCAAGYEHVDVGEAARRADLLPTRLENNQVRKA